MFLDLKHKSLHVYAAVRELVKEVYRVAMLLPSEERLTWYSKLDGLPFQ